MKNLRGTGIFLSAMAFLACGAPAGADAGTDVQAKENIALGKKYTLEPRPNYKYSTDADDIKQLTDGVKYEGGKGLLWTRKETVGWNGVAFAEITLDLEKTEPIAGVAFHTAFDGPENVRRPAVILVAVSDDGKTFRKVCNLADDEGDLKDYFSKRRHRICEYSNKSLNTRGRYVKFIVSSNYIFCDEIEIYRGPAGLLNKAPDGEVTDDNHVIHEVFNRNVKRILFTDLNDIRKNAAELRLERKIDTVISSCEKEITNMNVPLPPPDYKAVTPLNEFHRRILQVNAGIMRLHGIPSFSVWNGVRWAPLNAAALPESRGEPLVSFEMLNNEHRGAVLNLTNAESNEIEVKISFAGLPGGGAPEYLSLFQVEFVGAASAEMVADPLAPLRQSGDEFSVKVPSGMTRQIWINCNPEKLAVGLTGGEMILKTDASGVVKVPVSIKIYPGLFPDRPSLSLWVWDYTDESKPFLWSSMTDANLRLAAADMKAHYVNTVWGRRKAACWPDKEDFDAAGNLTAPLKTKVFDEWVGRHGMQMNYALYIGNALETFAGEPAGTERSVRMISQWLAKLAEHAKEKGIDAEKQLMLLLIDEPSPSRPGSFKTNAAWGKIVKESTARIRIFCDASGFETDSRELREMLKYTDIICPHLPSYAAGMDKVLKCIKESSDAPKELAFYSCIGGRTADPYYYYRLQAWYCLAYNAGGMGYWNYWNYWRNWKNPGEASWNELASLNMNTYGLVYTTENSLVGSKRWEAVREGIEDYEYFVILRRKIQDLKNTGKQSPLLDEAEKLLAGLPSKIIGSYQKNLIHWKTDKDRNAADAARIEILNMLEKLANE